MNILIVIVPDMIYVAIFSATFRVITFRMKRVLNEIYKACWSRKFRWIKVRFSGNIISPNHERSLTRLLLGKAKEEVNIVVILDPLGHPNHSILGYRWATDSLSKS